MKTQNTNTSTGLPGYLTDYLLGLAEKSGSDGLHIFALTPLKLGPSWIQGVVHTEQLTGQVTYHRLFGFPPRSGILTADNEGTCTWRELTDAVQKPAA